MKTKLWKQLAALVVAFGSEIFSTQAVVMADDTVVATSIHSTPQPAASHDALEKLLEMVNRTEDAKSVLASAKIIYRQAAKTKPDPQMSFALALIAYNAKRPGDLSLYARRAWDDSSHTMLPAATLYGRSLLDRRQYRLLLELAEVLMVQAQEPQRSADERQLRAVLAGKLVGFFPTVEADELPKRHRQKLDEFDERMRQIPAPALVEEYANAYSSVLQTLAPPVDSPTTTDDELDARLNRFSRDAENAELGKELVEAGRQKREQQLELTINAIDVQLTGKLAEFQQREAVLNRLYAQYQALQLQRTPLAQLGAAERTITAANLNMAMLVEHIQTLMRQRGAAEQEFKTLTGRAAKLNAELNSQRAQLDRQRQNLSKSMSKSAQIRMTHYEASAHVIPINTAQEAACLLTDVRNR